MKGKDIPKASTKVPFQTVKDKLLSLQLKDLVGATRRGRHIMHLSIPANEDNLIFLFRIGFDNAILFHSLAVDLPLLNERPDLFLKILKHALCGLGPLELLTKLLWHLASSLSSSSPIYIILLSPLFALLTRSVLLRVASIPKWSKIVWDIMNRMRRTNLPVRRLRRLSMRIAKQAVYSQKSRLVFRLPRKSAQEEYRSWHEPFSHRLR